MFKTLAEKVKKDDDLPRRAWWMDVLNRVLDGKLYDVLDKAFFEEYDGQGKYILMRDRRPSVQCNLPKVVVNDSVSLLFSEGHFPMVYCGGDEADQGPRKTIARLIKDTLLNQTMIDAATRGSVGSVVILVTVRKYRLFFEVKKTQYLTPTFDETPDVVKSLVEQYKCSGLELRDAGYAIAKTDYNSVFWFKREWDNSREIWYHPVKVDGSAKDPPNFSVDDSRTVAHNMGFCPVLWIKNLPGGDDLDGLCTFEPAVPNSIEMDYQLSQGGRGLKYSSQPTTVIKSDNPTDPSKEMIAGDSLFVPTSGDAKLLEISGNATNAVLEYVRCLRELGLESVGGNRTDGHKMATAQSGKAMELMNQGLVWLADKLRISYGEGALLSLLNMVRLISHKYELVFKDGSKVGQIPMDKALSLKWPSWYPPTASDRQADAAALASLKAVDVISTESAVTSIASVYDIEDIQDELKKIKADTELDAQVQIKIAAASTAQEKD